MFDPHKDWMPIGTVVRMEGAERLVMIVGYMAIDGMTGRAWDYAGYPYPEGKQDPSELFFDRGDIAELYQLGFCDAEGIAFLAQLRGSERSYDAERARRSKSSTRAGVGEVSHG